jgi:3-hydroxyacyl-CoA dehydrogenase
MMSAVRIERDGDVAVVVIDNPPINAGSQAVRAGLLDAVAEIGADTDIRAAVLIGANGTFVAGSDLREFGKPLEWPELPQVIAAIGACPKPVVAALDGAALGGGLELALGCDARIAAPGTRLGLPEVTLGMIPGAGGTQRLPRLTGVAKAIDLICGGARVDAREAHALGIVDAIAEGPLRDAATAYARLLEGKRRVADRTVPPEDPAVIVRAAEQALKRGRSRPAVQAAITAVGAALDCPWDEALANEREVFTALRCSAEAAALRHLFFAERRAARGPAGATPRRLSHVGVVGAGTMGAGIAAALLGAGLEATLVDSNKDALLRGTTAVEAILGRWRDSGRIDEAQARDRLARLASNGDVAALSSCDAVIEAIVEDMTAKQDLLAALSGVLARDAIIASNTSYLDLEALTDATVAPERVLGLHFFNPPHVMRLLEVVRASRTSDDTLATGLSLARRLDKQPVVAGVGPGFIGNRIYAAYRRQCEFMVEDGAWPEQIDAALEAFGFAMGPFATGDLSGLDIAWAMRRAQVRDPAQRYVTIADRLCEAGRLGRKTGKGWYDYSDGGSRGKPDSWVRSLIEEVASERGVRRRAFTPEEIVDRVLATMVNEAAILLHQKVARQASDIDVVFVHGYGFPRHEGGPLWWASRQDRNRLDRALNAAEVANGPGFARGDVDALLLAATGE